MNLQSELLCLPLEHIIFILPLALETSSDVRLKEENKKQLADRGLM